MQLIEKFFITERNFQQIRTLEIEIHLLTKFHENRIRFAQL
jgi:hypothetical protein